MYSKVTTAHMYTVGVGERDMYSKVYNCTHIYCRCGRYVASFPGSPSPRTNYTRVTFDLAERLRESLVHFGT